MSEKICCSKKFIDQNSDWIYFKKAWTSALKTQNPKLKTQHSVHVVNSEGFTLMELMIVIVVFGLLVGAAGSSIRNMIVTSKMEAQSRLLETDVRSCYLKAGSVMTRCSVRLNSGDYEFFSEDNANIPTRRKLSGGFTLSSNFWDTKTRSYTNTVSFFPSSTQGAGLVAVSPSAGTITLTGPGDRKKKIKITPNVANITVSD